MVVLGGILKAVKTVGSGVVDAVKGVSSKITNKKAVSDSSSSQYYTKKSSGGSGGSVLSTVGAVPAVTGLTGVVGSLLGGNDSDLDNKSKNENPTNYTYTNYQETVNTSSSDIIVSGDGNTIYGGVADAISKPSSSPEYTPSTSQGNTGSASEGLTGVLGGIDSRTAAAVGLGVCGVYLLGKYLGKPSYRSYYRRY